MPIKYWELTIIYAEEPNPFLVWLNIESPKKEDQYIILFDNGEICELKDKWINFDFNFYESVMYPTPYYFKKTIGKEIYFKKDGLTSTLFSNEPCIESKYNSIYYCINILLTRPDVFGIKRIKSSDSMPRFQIAYDSDEFTKEEIMYLLHYIFTLTPLEN
jgi:hypothetical protein